MFLVLQPALRGLELFATPLRSRTRNGGSGNLRSPRLSSCLAGVRSCPSSWRTNPDLQSETILAEATGTHARCFRQLPSSRRERDASVLNNPG